MSAPRPPCSTGQAGAAQPASANRWFQSRSTSRSSSSGALPPAAATSGVSSRSSHARSSARNRPAVSGSVDVGSVRVSLVMVWLRWPTVRRGVGPPTGTGRSQASHSTPDGTTRYRRAGRRRRRARPDGGSPPPDRTSRRPARAGTRRTARRPRPRTHRRPYVVGHQHGLRWRRRGLRWPAAGPDHRGRRLRRPRQVGEVGAHGVRPRCLDRPPPRVRRRRPAAGAVVRQRHGHRQSGGTPLHPVARAPARPRPGPDPPPGLRPRRAVRRRVHAVGPQCRVLGGPHGGWRGHRRPGRRGTGASSTCGPGSRTPPTTRR